MELFASFQIGLSQNLISIFEPSLEYPLNDWLPENNVQGFSWRPQSVSFKTLGHGSNLDAEIWMANKINPLLEKTVRAILVPFSVSSSNIVAIEDAPGPSNEHTISICEGEYTLIFETGFKEELRDDPKYEGRKVILLPTWCRLTFIAEKSRQAEILRCDESLSPS
ncbi:MAG TPA: competence protein ComJ, partial [Coleofasciculaceae cyanobacterium]